MAPSKRGQAQLEQEQTRLRAAVVQELLGQCGLKKDDEADDDGQANNTAEATETIEVNDKVAFMTCLPKMAQHREAPHPESGQ